MDDPSAHGATQRYGERIDPLACLQSIIALMPYGKTVMLYCAFFWKAKEEGLWNLWLPAHLAASLKHLVEDLDVGQRSALLGPGLNNLEYAHLCEITGRCLDSIVFIPQRLSI